MNKSISFVLVLTILLQNCIVYQKNSVSLDETVDKGKIKGITTSGEKYKFKYISKHKGVYYGLLTKSDSIIISTEQITEAYRIKPDMHQVLVKLKDQNAYKKGVLYQIKDSSIVVSNAWNFDDYHSDNFVKAEYQLADIKKIKVRRKNKVWRGMAIGAISGIVVDGIIILASKDPFAVLYLALTIPLGAVVGATVGAAQKSYKLDGSYSNFQIMKKELLGYSIIEINYEK